MTQRLSLLLVLALCVALPLAVCAETGSTSDVVSAIHAKVNAATGKQSRVPVTSFFRGVSAMGSGAMWSNGQCSGSAEMTFDTSGMHSHGCVQTDDGHSGTASCDEIGKTFAFAIYTDSNCQNEMVSFSGNWSECTTDEYGGMTFSMKIDSCTSSAMALGVSVLLLALLALFAHATGAAF